MITEEFVENGYKISIGRQRTRITTYEDMRLYTSHPVKDPDKKKIKPTVPSEYKDHNYYLRLKQRKSAIRELAYNSFSAETAMMLTLTFRGKMLNLEEANKAFYLFIKRVNDHYDKFKYLATFSRQTNGNWHYHVICNFNPKQIHNRDVTNLWKNGITHITLFNNSGMFPVAINYLISNMVESASDTQGKRGYINSKNLERNIIITSYKSEDTDAFDAIFPAIQKSSNRILYETRNHLGIKGQNVNEDTGEVYDIHISGIEYNEQYKNAGYESWDTIYTHLTSSARFDDKFSPLETAEKKKKKFKRHSAYEWNLDEADLTELFRQLDKSNSKEN